MRLAPFRPEGVHVGAVLPNGWTLLAYEDYAVDPITYDTTSQVVLALINDRAERDEVDGNYVTYFRHLFSPSSGRVVSNARYWRNIHDASNWMQTEMGCDR